ncbi:MAG: peptide deformylase [bacterium]|nr:peptide deformylase [bacterium]
MTLLNIKTQENSVLRRKAKPVKAVDLGVQRLMHDMLETMYKAPGVGLAAPQVGISKRIIVVDVGEEGPGPVMLANPKLIVLGDEEELGSEGCLSCPGLIGDVWRASKIAVKGLNENNEKVTVEAEGFFARALQHEIDHLDGILYIDKAENIRTPEEEAQAQEAAQAQQAAKASE